MDREKRLYRSKDERKLFGVCGGIAQYFNIDPTIIRLAAVFASFASGIGVVAYIACALIIPEEPDYGDYVQ